MTLPFNWSWEKKTRRCGVSTSMTSTVGTTLGAEIKMLTVSIMVPLLGCQTHCYFRNNAITHGLHTYWKDSGQDNSWVMCIRRSLCQHFLDSFHRAVYQTKQNLNHMLGHVYWCATSESRFVSEVRPVNTVWLLKVIAHAVCDPLWDLQVALRFLTPPSHCSDCVSSTYLRQAPLVGREVEEK